MASRQIVITGIGVVSPIGIGREAFWASLGEGRSGVRAFQKFDAGALPVRFGGEVLDFDPKLYVQPRKSLKVMSRDIQLSCAAARLACDDAGLAPEAIDPERLGVVFGTDLIYCELPELAPVFKACLVDGEHHKPLWGTKAMSELYPLWMLKYLPNMAACHIGIAIDSRGPNNSITLGEVSSLLAIAEGVRTIERGHADAMIVGGGSSRLHPTPMLYRGDMRLSHRNDDPAGASRPFDAARDGLVNGEGAAAFILERREAAERRGARIMASVLGYSATYEPGVVGGSMRGTAIRRVLAEALAAAELTPSQLGHVNAHGLSTVAEDRIEAQAIQDVLNDVPVTAPKSFFGNLGAGGGAVELAASALALQAGEIPFTLNYQTPDPACPVNVVHTRPAPSRHPTALKLNFATTGQAAALILARQ